MGSIRTGQTDVEVHRDQGGEYVDVRVQGEMAATVKVDDGTVTVQAIDPNHPEDAHAEYEFPLPDE